MKEHYHVFVKVDDVGRILTINSSAFLVDASDWTQIDEGCDDRHHHAQGNYFEHPLVDECGVYRYKLVDGVPTERTIEEMSVDRMV